MDRQGTWPSNQCQEQKKKPNTRLTPQATEPSGKRRWFLADPSLIDNTGHCARYLLSIAQPLRHRGEIVHILGNRNLDDATGDLANCKPLFTLRCEEMPFIPCVDPETPQGVDHVRKRRIRLLCDDLNRLNEEMHLTASDVLLINSLRHWSLEDIVEWLEACPPEKTPLVVLVLHYTPFPQANRSDPTAFAYREGFRRIANSPVGKKMVLCTDSDRLAAQYGLLSDVQVHVLPIPHSPQNVHYAGRQEASLCIGFAGEARHDKGFHLLPHVVRRIREEEPGRKFLFEFQSYGLADDQRAILAAQEGFRPSDPVRFISSPLSEKDYEAFIATVDLMLIPYLRGPYHAQTSGVYCEAAALGIPAVVPRDTWMADQIARSGGGLEFEAGDAESLATACLTAVRNFPALRDRALSAAPAWCAFHSAENYITRLEALL